MIDIIEEMFANLFQAFMFVGFLYFFFGTEKSKKINIISLCSVITTLFAAICFFNFYTGYIGFKDIFVYIAIMEIYTLVFLNGNKWIRLIMPFVNMLVNGIVSFSFGYIVSFATGESFSDLIYKSSIYRYFCLALVNLTNLLVLWLIVRLAKKKINLMKWTDISAFILIPTVALFIIHCTFFILSKTSFQPDIIGYLAIICIGMIAVVITIMLMMISISKNYEIKTKLLLSEQREKLYEENVLQTHNQIEKIAKIKHDMKNRLLCIEKLINDNKYIEAKELCGDILHNMSGVYTPLNTKNPLLNAIVNVELEKAVSQKIVFTVEISDSLANLENEHDIISIIGNLCDNAIEYLSSVPLESRQMSLEIASHNKYYIITCKNKILKSVLNENPHLKSSKKDFSLHGKGTEIIKNIATKYNGDTKIYEEDGFFCSSVILKN